MNIESGSIHRETLRLIGLHTGFGNLHPESCMTDSDLGSHSQPRSNEHQYHHNVVANRTGEVLIKNTLLKSDHFPGAPTYKDLLYRTYLVSNKLTYSAASLPRGGYLLKRVRV